MENQAEAAETFEPVTEDQIISEEIMEAIKAIDTGLDLVLAPAPVAKPVKAVAVKAAPKKVAWTQPAPYSWAASRFDDGYLQPSGMTKEERYPKIYDAAAKMKPKAKRVLSFGCSTGEEAQALAKRFPSADQIVGVDIDHTRIATARKSNKQKNVFFYDTSAGLGKFDVVTALNVFFCLEKPIPKVSWTETLELVVDSVAPGGLLMIFKSDYDPMEVLSKDFTAENVWMHKHNRNDKDYFCGYYRKKSNWWQFV